MAKNPINLAAIALIRVYKNTLAFYWGGKCRFQPSCSNYALEAYQKRSFLMATYLTSKRIFKCHPLGPYGVDLVPAKRKTNAK